MFFAGVFLINALPHLIKGLLKEPFPTPFGGSPVVNFVAGWFMLLIVSGLVYLSDSTVYPVQAFIAAAAGGLVMGLFHAWHGAFGRK